MKQFNHADVVKAKRNSLSLDDIKALILPITSEYPITRITLFGSRANGTNKEDSDVDLIMEFCDAISLLTLARIKYELEDILGVPVDVIHGPIRDTDLIEVGKVVELYAA